MQSAKLMLHHQAQCGLGMRILAKRSERIMASLVVYSAVNLPKTTLQHNASMNLGKCNMQMVDRYDRGALPRQDFSSSYSSLYKLVQKALFRTHVEGQLKGEIIQDPARYVELDPDMAKALLDQRAAVSHSAISANILLCS